MIHTGRAIATGTEVEIRRGDYIVVARVMWRDGGRAGLRADALVPVEQLMSLGQTPTLQIGDARIDRRKQPRSVEASRLRGRAMEFGAFVAIGACLAVAGLSMVQSAFARPIEMVSAALDR
jgi:hypothetical protein